MLKQENVTLQKRIGDCPSMKEVEMKTDLLKSEYDEILATHAETINTLQSQLKAQKFEIEGNLLKKLNQKQNEEKQKIEDFFKFKADVYQYLDNKQENLQSVYNGKFQTVFEFIERADERIRTLWDQKSANEFGVEDFKTKQQQKIIILEDQVKEAKSQSTLVESKLKEY